MFEKIEIVFEKIENKVQNFLKNRTKSGNEPF